MGDSAAPRAVGIDEGPFGFDQEAVPVAAVLTRGAHVVEAIALATATVDGFDATQVVVDLVARFPGAGPQVVFLDGITLGGMNVVDLDEATARCGRPVVGVTRRAPDRDRMAHALEQAPSPERRRESLPRTAPLAIATTHGIVHVQVPDALLQRDGTEVWTTRLGHLVAATTQEGTLPEPLRLAHHVATAAARGVSGTRA